MRQTKTKQIISRGKGPRKQQDALVHFTHPPPINPQIKHRQRVRFIVTGADQVNKQITFANLCNTINVALTAITTANLFDQVKVHSVEVWAVAASSGGSAQPIAGAVTVQVAFTGNAAGLTGDGRVWSDTSMGMEPAHVKAVPSKMSQAAQWQIAQAQNAFSITAPLGSVVDVDLSFRNDDSGPTAGTVPVAAAAGEVYWMGLDGLPIATTVFQPQAQSIR